MKVVVPRLRTSKTCPAASRMSDATTLMTGSLILVSGEHPKLVRITRRFGEAEMLEGVRGQQPPARRALDEALLDQERLDNVLDGVAWLRKRGRHGVDANRSAAVADRDGGKIAPVHGIEPRGIHFQFAERAVGGFAVDSLGAVDMGKIAHTP